MKNFWKLLISIGLCEGVGLLGSVFTFPAIGGWYKTLNKPTFTPPNWIFGPVWTTLFFLMGIALYLVWKKGSNSKKTKAAKQLFWLQLWLNFLWSIIFFGWHLPLLALVEIIFLWVAIVLTILKFAKIARLASYLLLPYLFWASLALILNFSIVLLN